MLKLRNITFFCVLITLFACSGLRKSPKIKKYPLVEISTEYGKMTIDLYDKTPLHKANFIKLANQGYFNSTLFHRVIRNFMIQGGDPDSKNASKNKALGNGGPGYKIPAEFDSTLFHKKGVIAAAREGENNPEKESAGSQFYLVQGKVYTLKQLKQLESRMEIKFSKEQIKAYTTVGGTPHLDGGYTVFGEVISGIEVIDKIANVKKNRTLGNRPIKDVKMKIKVIYLSQKQIDELIRK